MRYCLCMKNNNPRIIHERFDAEFADNTKWTRARVEVKIGSAVIFALRMDKNNATWQQMLSSWPSDCSVRYEWFESVIADIKLNPIMCGCDDTYENLYNVLVHWLESVDSVKNRKLLILHSCNLSMTKVGKMTGLSRQTASRRYTNALDALVWRLNHPKD